ncbi:class I SAM-dependent methyltransferase (plasmid) [Lysinibacillus capsici]|uniref:class I SAM-dependent methyltransferase n=1 Tax=Lysinibacillus capsici TaxID=2115968 RepID=UPI0021D8EF6C|nr:class I SAM-dependent methyltransferase [Lysinibacillus capsici]UYB49957.1 class I SAM-dependent methyltransferase [Lysinibacillus capsici]
MKLKANATEQKLAGRYYTPIDLAGFIVRWGMDETVNTILEPSCGDGVFLEALRQYDGNFTCKGIEISATEAALAAERLALDERFNVVVSDFYDYYNDNRNGRYDFIVGNPPYIRYQYLTEEQRDIQSNLLIENQMRPNKLINAWVAFTVAAVSLLEDNAKVAFVIPAELFQVKYAEQLRSYLMRNLNEITILTFNELIFDGIEQEVVVLLGRKIPEFVGIHQMKILEFNNVNDLIERFDERNAEQGFQNIDTANIKWTKYFLNSQENQVISRLRVSESCIRFGDIAQVDIGITTGNNAYFCVNEETAENYDLLDISRPLIARSVNIPGVTFEQADWESNVEQGAKTFLLDFNQLTDLQITERQKAYIELGEQNEEHTGYKCSIRERWYAIPSIWEPDAFFLRRNHQYPKFVLNNCHAVSTDTMHRVSFLMGTDRKKTILSYYNSIAFAFTELEGRSYGGGVLEILPRELESVTIPNINDMIIADEIIDELFEGLNIAIRENRNIEEILDWIDQTLLVERLDIPAADVAQCRAIWHRLKNRRLNRGIAGN